METKLAANTPGPWKAECVGTSGSPDNPKDVYEVTARDRRVRVAEYLTEPDARLIAASPRLLEACKLALAMFAKGHALDKFDWAKSALDAAAIEELNETPGKLRQAISEAEGGQDNDGVRRPRIVVRESWFEPRSTMHALVKEVSDAPTP